jgi:hypothetical protein
MANINSSSLPRHRGHVRVSPETAVKVREFIARWGEHVAANVFGLDRHTVVRCAAGLTMQGLALNAIEEGLLTPEDEIQQFVAAGHDRRLKR